LFKRDNRKVALTHSGHKLLSFSKQALKEWQQLKIDLKADSDALQGEISVFCSVTASQSHLPSMLRQFREQHPGVDIRLITGDPALAIEKVKSKQCDLSIAIYTPDMPTDLHFSALDDVPLVLIAPREWRLTQLSQLDWTKHKVIMPETGPTRRTAYHWFAEHGIRPNVYAYVGGNEAIVSMVALECGVGFVPKVVLNHSSMASAVTQIQVDDIEPYALGLCCLQNKQHEPLVDAFLKLDVRS
jgi:LysR family positive regulator for ilvC